MSVLVMAAQHGNVLEATELYTSTWLRWYVFVMCVYNEKKKSTFILTGLVQSKMETTTLWCRTRSSTSSLNNEPEM